MEPVKLLKGVTKIGIKDVIITLNNLTREGVIQGYAIGGGYAAMYYDVPTTTYDVDVLVVLPSEPDFHKLYQYFRDKGAKIEDVYIFINDMPVQFLPNYISPLFHNAIEEAIEVEFDDIRGKFVSIEYLIALLLLSYRPKDKIRIQSLLDKADKSILAGIIQRFDDDQGKLFERYKRILEYSSNST